MTFVTDSNRPQPPWQPPPTACLTASGAASEVPSLLIHPCSAPAHLILTQPSWHGSRVHIPKRTPHRLLCCGSRADRMDTTDRQRASPGPRRGPSRRRAGNRRTGAPTGAAHSAPGATPCAPADSTCDPTDRRVFPSTGTGAWRRRCRRRSRGLGEGCGGGGCRSWGEGVSLRAHDGRH